MDVMKAIERNTSKFSKYSVMKTSFFFTVRFRLFGTVLAILLLDDKITHFQIKSLVGKAANPELPKTVCYHFWHNKSMSMVRYCRGGTECPLENLF